MKKLNNKGFTLIELLAVITIMGILMLVAIPAISRTIENSRKNTFVNTTKLYMDAVRTAVVADEVKCNGDYISSVADGTYYVNIAGPGDWMQSGGTSSWGGREIKGYISITKATTTVAGTTDSTTIKYTYGAYLNDGTHGLKSEKSYDDVARADIAVSGATNPAAKTTNTCILAD